jgi:hypothetical protein
MKFKKFPDLHLSSSGILDGNEVKVYM